MNRGNILPEVLREALDYNEESGALTWKARPVSHFKKRKDSIWWNAKFPGTEAFKSVDKDGYWCGSICDRKLRAHRVIWAVVYGDWPADLIDHKDGDVKNNKIQNLRLATNSQNQQNKKFSSNKSGFKGVYVTGKKFTDAKRYQAMIQVNGSQKFLGLYPTAEEAHKAYCDAAVKHFGEFARAT